MNAIAEKTNANGNGCAADTKTNDDNSDGGGGGGDSETNAANGPNDTKKSAASTATAISTDVSLPNEVLERLFQRYSIKQRRAGLECFLVTSVLFDLWVIFVPQPEKRFERIGISCVFLVLNLALALFLRFCGSNKCRGATWEIAPHLAWLFAILQLTLQLCIKDPVTTRDFVGYAILLNFLVYVTLPVPLLFAGIVLGAGTFLIYIITIFIRAPNDNLNELFWHQQIANGILMATAAAIGLLFYFLGETKQRRAFLEAKQSLDVKMVIEEQSAEQERLLLSVLPEHVAVKVRQDLGSNDSEQFKKIYMSRHENVSILYADIVGFTAISSTYSAQDLVKMLNELFARFDRLAEKYHQLRIKILGDCYYCISGTFGGANVTNVERSDHAVLCVHMGLSMVKAIKYVQQKTNSPVDMRVGIHTGAILAGILGQRQWQYDVYSKDVELANKMESSGMAGRVHISEKTLQCLNGEFEVEPAFGEKREETLRIAGLKTYFIKKVLIPFSEENEGSKNGEDKSNSTAVAIEDDGPSETFKDEESKCNTPVDEVDKPSKEEIFKKRLQKELVSRDGHGELSKETNILLQFKNKELETSYEQQRESMSSVPLIASVLIHVVASVYSSLILPSSFVHFLVVIAPIILTLPTVWISAAESFPMYFSDKVINISKRFNDIHLLRRFAAILTIAIVGLTNLMDMFLCASTLESNPLNATLATISPTPNIIDESSYFASTVCIQYPSYFSNYAILILIATSIVVQLTHVCKFILMLIIAGLHCYMNVFQLDEHFMREEIGDPQNKNLLRYSLSALLILVSVALGLLSRHMDKENRVIFKWKCEVTEQKEKASDMRRRNEKLVYNILPIHVAEYFIRNKQRSYDELYSQSYDEVGVLFASMPNFSDFYSEDAVNNQGLECLRFLNEVISDFDALLNVPQFQDVIKIKTIGSTYMAASGLNNVRNVKDGLSITERWDHLATLVEFALELKKALQCINEQSFNHFVLKMGINHGPITAGVIGARKPHYDIWGNTVNVASRMESTGKAGAIQVTQETCEILQKYGYRFEQRGLVAVKGKGQLMTYYLSGKTSDGAQNTTLSPSLSHTTRQQPASNPISPKTGARQPAATDLTDVTLTPQTNQKVIISPLSSCSNSPSSVRINQNYDPNSVRQRTLNDNETNDTRPNAATAAAEAATDGDCDLDNSEDADSKPLLNATNTVTTEPTQIVTKRSTNGRYDASDQKSEQKADSDNDENETLITNNHN